ncbi:hypothetical protein JXB27_03110 [Candidatus Woesearchaeota archaeon]|nr:hypothetical protein [Candidatus Woesearchaeota archaeon]
MNERPNPENPVYSVHSEMEKEKKKLSFKYFFIFLIIGLFITAGILYFVNGPQEITASPSDSKLTALVVMASAIEDNFMYSAQPNNAYIEESTIYIYVEVKGVQQNKDGSVDVGEDIEITDSSGNEVFSRNDFVEDKNTYQVERTSMRFSNIIPSTGWNNGKYYAKIVINDRKAGKSLTKSISFTITEGSAEAINTLADLSSIIPDAKTARLVRQQTVWDPEGRIIDVLTFNQTIETDLSTLDLSRIIVDFKMPGRFAPGIYAVEIKYINLENGQSKSIKQNIEVTKGFEVSEMIFANSIDESYNFDVKPNSNYFQGEVVYVYMRIVDFEQPEINGQFSSKLVEDLYILNEAGDIVASQKRYLVVNELNAVKQDYYRTKSVFKADLLPGKYSVRAVFKDENSGKEAVREESFIIG